MFDDRQFLLDHQWDVWNVKTGSHTELDPMAVEPIE